MSISVITEASVTAWGMGVSHWLEHSSPDSPGERTLIWAREFTWDDETSDDALQELAVKALDGIGYRPLAWWLFTAPADDHYPNEPYWHSVVERIPGSDLGWRSGLT